MEFLEESVISCPYCGESLDVLLDPQEVGQQYIEDCQVCCKPITFELALDANDDVVVFVRDENHAF